MLALASIWLGWPIIITIFAVAVSGAAAALAQLGLKCHKCGVSYFFDPTMNGWNFTGVNMLKPVAVRCSRCGASR